jgi:nicotinamidase-related amidase
MPAVDPEHFAPDNARTVLLVVDVVNALEFDGAEVLLEPALAMAEQIAGLKAACRAVGIPAIYANDNFGRWQSNIDLLIERLTTQQVRGAPLIRRLKPEGDDYRVLKPKHSAFYAAPLNLLLHRLGAENLLITGLTTDRCVAFTANDAYMRDYRVFVPRDCCAAEAEDYHRDTLRTLERVVDADTSPWAALDLVELAGAS